MKLNLDPEQVRRAVTSLDIDPSKARMGFLGERDVRRLAGFLLVLEQNEYLEIIKACESAFQEVK